MYSIVKIGELKNKNGELFTAYRGFDKTMVAQIRERSLDESDVEIRKNTSDYERFGIGSYENWHKQGRYPYALIHQKTGFLAGIVWFGKKEIGKKPSEIVAETVTKMAVPPKDIYWCTLAYRSYKPFRGTGFMKNFAKMCLEDYRAKNRDARFWLGIHEENPVSERFAKSIGFVIDESRSNREEHHIVMVESEQS